MARKRILDTPTAPKYAKNWCFKLIDDDYVNLDIADQGRLTNLELLIKAKGDRGRIVFSPPYKLLKIHLQIGTKEDIKSVFNRLKHFIKHSENSHGKITVTRHKWHKYQEDTTMKERQNRHRSSLAGNNKGIIIEKEKELKEHTQASPDPKIIKKLGEVVKDLSLKTKKNFYPLVQKYIRLPPEKTLEIISSILNNLKEIEKPWPYAEQALRTSLARYHLNLSVVEQEKYKQIFEQFIRGPP